MNNSATTLQQIRPQLPVRLFNGFGALLEKTRIPSTRMFAKDLIETAKRRSGLDDFGEGDFFEALSRLLESSQDEARLNLIGKIALKTDVLETLCARLQMEQDRRLYPDITSQEIRNDARIAGKLINVADKPGLCDFYLGSIVKKGNLKIAISTNGKSPTQNGSITWSNHFANQPRL